jgi:hypothetical protein
LPFLTRRRGGSYVRGEKPVIDTRPDRSPPAHSRHNAFAADWRQLCGYWRWMTMTCRVLTPDRRVFSDSQKVIEPASYGQPENLVGKVWFFYRCLNGRIRCPCSRHREQARSHNGSGTPFASHHSSGRALARLQPLILIHPPLREAEWRCSSGGQARSAVRRSRTHREEVEAKPTGGDAPR